MTDAVVDVAGSGAVLLGNEVVCDGFHIGFPIRAQSHVHDDHMADFNTSKGYQDIYLTRPTRRMLENQFDADLPYRSNLIDVESGETRAIENGKLTLIKNDHMLGSAQVMVELASGQRLGYSGDFQWPMDHPMEVDSLVVDSTYGSPESVRRYTQGEAEERLLNLVNRSLRGGPVHLKSHRGTVQRALQALGGEIDCPLIASERFISEVNIYREFGYAIGDILVEKSEAAKAAVASNRCIHLYCKGDRMPVDIGAATMITLSAFMAKPDDPVVEYSERSYGVAMSNHADFNGTIDYVQATGANEVITDNIRGPHGVELAMALRAKLGVNARPSSHELSLEWGQ